MAYRKQPIPEEELMAKIAEIKQCEQVSQRDPHGHISLLLLKHGIVADRYEVEEASCKMFAKRL